MLRQVRPICWNENMPVHAPPLDCSGDCSRYPNCAYNFLSEIHSSVNRAAVQCLGLYELVRLCLGQRLVEAGLTLVVEAQQLPDKDFAHARGIRNGLMIALLAVCPNRLKNFSTLGAPVQASPRELVDRLAG